MVKPYLFSKPNLKILVDAVWTEWDEWSGCPGTCGTGGFQQRRRECIQEAKFGGRDCMQDLQLESELCDLPECRKSELKTLLSELKTLLSELKTLLSELKTL